MGLSTVSIALGHSGWAEYSLRLNAAAWKAWDAACITAGKWLHTLASYVVLQSGSSVLNRVYKKGQMKRYWDLQFDNLMIWRQQFSTHNKMRKRVTIWGVTREWKCNCSSFLQIVSVLFLSFFQKIIFHDLQFCFSSILSQKDNNDKEIAWLSFTQNDQPTGTFVGVIVRCDCLVQILFGCCHSCTVELSLHFSAWATQAEVLCHSPSKFQFVDMLGLCQINAGRMLLCACISIEFGVKVHNYLFY